MLIRSVVGVACLGALASCATTNDFPDPEWNALGVMLDQSPRRRGEEPIIERGAMVYAKLVVGGVGVSSSDESVLEVTQVEERVVGENCDDHAECVDDLDTWFVIVGRAVGEASIVVSREGGRDLLLPLAVAEGVTVEIADFGTGEIVDEALVVDHATFAEVIVRDERGRLLVTHATWTLDDTDAVEFPEQSPAPATNLFIRTSPDLRVSEGPIAGIATTGGGTTRLTLETSAGLTTSVATRSEP